MPAFLTFLLATLALAAPTTGAENRPNILVIVSDDHACQAVGAYGSKIVQTPHIDRIAAEGVRFERCYAVTGPLGESQTCFLTGKYAHKSGPAAEAFSPNQPQAMFPQLLRGAGYQTSLFGMWSNVRQPPDFDFWQIQLGEGRYYDPKFMTRGVPGAQPEYVTDSITGGALRWLRKNRDTSKPFLLIVQHKASQSPWQPGPSQLKAPPGDAYPEPATLFDDYKNRADASRDAKMRIADDLTLVDDLKAVADSPSAKELEELMSLEERAAWKAFYGPIQKSFAAAPPEGKELVRWKYQRYLQDYLRCVQSVDESVGQLLGYLDESGLAKNTVVVYASSHGAFLGEHGWFGSRSMYEPALRAPLVIRWPGVVGPGTVEGRIASNVDLAETILDVAAVEIPSDMQGRSLAPLLRGQPVENWRTTSYYRYTEPPDTETRVAEHDGVTDGRYKLIHFGKLNQWELFDLADDPDELHSVYGHPSYASVRSRLTEDYQRLRTELEVPPDAEPEIGSH